MLVFKKMKTNHNGLYIALKTNFIAFLVGASVVSGVGAAVVIHDFVENHLPIPATHIPYDPDFKKFCDERPVVEGAKMKGFFLNHK